MAYKTFDSMKIGLASPDQIRAWSYGVVERPEQSTTEHRSPKEAVCTAKRYLVLQRTGSVPAVNTRESVSKVKYVSVAALK